MLPEFAGSLFGRVTDQIINQRFHLDRLIYEKPKHAGRHCHEHQSRDRFSLNLFYRWRFTILRKGKNEKNQHVTPFVFKGEKKMNFCISHFRSDRKSFKVCENQRQKSEREKFSSKNPPRLDSLLLSHKSIMSLERRWFYPLQPVA